MIFFDNIPQELRSLPQWVCWRFEQRTNSKGENHKTKVLKIPGVFQAGYPTNAKADNPQTWRSFSVAVEAYQRNEKTYDGIGFVPLPEQGFVLVDIDQCITENGISATAQQILDRFDTYSERSVSHAGIHVVAKGDISAYVNKTGSRTGNAPIDGIKEIEVYCRGRYFTFTGDMVSRSEIKICQEAIDWLFCKYPSLNKRAKQQKAVALPATEVSLSDAEIIEKIRQSKSGFLFSTLFDAGDTSRYKGDDSAADMALMNMLPFWTGGDKEQMRRLFSASALGQREKWRNRPDYQELTLNEALNGWNGISFDPAEYAKQKQQERLDEITSDFQTDEEFLKEIFYYEFSDAGNAERLKALYGRDWLYCGNLKTWYKWDGQRWHESDGSELTACAVQVFRAMKEMAMRLDFEDEKIRQKHIAFFVRSCNAPAIAKAKSLFSDFVNVDECCFDRNTNLLNLPDGTLDLLTGELHPHRREDMLTQMTGCTAAADYRGRLWEKTITEILPDNDTREYFQRFCGYCLSGDVSEEKFVVCVGGGGKGKGTALETISAAMGNYSTAVPVEVVLKSKTPGNGEQPQAQLLNLRGKRLALCSESGLGRTLDEARIKWLTGGDSITARGLYARRPTSWKATHKMIMMSNYLPHIADAVDSGIKRRLVIVPFNAHISQVNTTLKSKLCQPEELQYVMAWLLEGYKKWQSAGLGDESAEMLLTKDKFYADNDVLLQWLQTQCIFGSGVEMPMKAGKDAYNLWLTGGRASTEKVSLKEFSQAMEKHGFVKKRKNDGFYFVGVGFKFSNDSNPFPAQ